MPIPITKCFASSDLKTKFNSEYIDPLCSFVGYKRFSECADYVFCYFPKYYVIDGKSESVVFVTNKKMDTDRTKLKKYFDLLLSKIPKEQLKPDTGIPSDSIHWTWIESALGKNWKEIIVNFCEKFLKINGITNLNNEGDCLLLALTKDDWKKIKSKIKPKKVETDLAKVYDENYDGSDLNLVELKKN